jgi:hypothetical protein
VYVLSCTPFAEPATVADAMLRAGWIRDDEVTTAVCCADARAVRKETTT